MNRNVLDRGRRRGVLLGLALAVAIGFPAQARADIWKSTFGQKWFYESAAGGQALAGTWWEGSLQPGTTYRISFRVKQIKGTVGLFVGAQSVKQIKRTGRFSFEFPVRDQKRRMIFTALNGWAMADVTEISVVRSSGEQAGSGGGDGGGGGGGWMPRGHYLAFARERNLRHEMLNYVDQPSRAPSNWHMRIARDIHDALSLQAVKGFSVEVDWRTIETGNGRYNWQLLDGNMAVARRLGIKFIVNVATRSFDGDNPMPRYFPDRHSVWTQGNGKRGYTAKLWDPWVSGKLIRLYRAINNRYGSDPAYGGIATSETAVGNISGGNYRLGAYRQALIQIATQTQSSLRNGKLFWYLNFVRGGDSANMRRDARINILKQVPHHSLVIGAPDVTPDVGGMPGSVNSYRIHARKTMGNLQQFCHLQHADLGLGGSNLKSNKHRIAYRNKVQRVRDRERRSWHDGPRAVFEFSQLSPSRGSPVQLHPDRVLGRHWKPGELFRFANRNFDCDYFFWHYRENVHNVKSQYWWEDIRPVILNNQYFYN